MMQHQRCLSSAQEDTLMAIADALLPPFVSHSQHNNDNDDAPSKQQQYWTHNLCTDAAFRQAAKETMETKLCPADGQLMLLLLSALSTAAGTSAICASLCTQPYRRLPLSRRVALLQALQNSSWSQRRKIFQGLKRILLGLALSYTNPNNNNDDNDNPYWAAMGFPGSPIHWQSNDEDQRRVQEAAQRLAPISAALLLNVHKHDDDKLDQLQFDVIIVGAGAGGCTAAAVLAHAGYTVLVVDKGAYLAPQDIVLNEAKSCDQQYEQHGLIATCDGSMMILAGSGVGGGTAINWSCCLRMPEHVRQEWINAWGLTRFGTAAYQESLNIIMQRLGANDTDRVVHNASNQHVLQGCRTLGYPCETTGQNLRDPSDKMAGFLGMGDRYANKNGAVQTFLIEAVQHGAKILPNCAVHKVLTDGRGAERRAVGIECTVGRQRMQIMATKTVILAAGALRTPCILQQSRFQNRHIGKHLRLHPVTGVFGITPPNEPTNPILGAPMTVVCNQFAMGENDDGYGCKLECPVASPGLLSAATPWRNSIHFRKVLSKYNHLSLMLVLQRDHGEGSVRLARDGQSLVVDYAVSKKDRSNILRGVKGAARILLASGLNSVGTCHIHDAIYQGTNVDECLAQIEKRGTKNNELGFFSAHQMGSCRMSTKPEDGVVDECGETWECNDLYIMDTSVFPTATGANPMVTAHAVAHMLSTRLVTTLLLRDELAGRPMARPFQDDKERVQAMQRMRERQERRSNRNRPLPYIYLAVPLSLVAVAAGVLLRQPRFLDSLWLVASGSRSLKT